MAKDIAFKLGAVLNDEEAEIFADGYNAAMLQGGQPVSQTYKLLELIEGMEVSIDVSTCDADFGNRYFGTVTEVSKLDTAKNGYILLVQDAKPNFDVNGNSPVSPGGWISCSEQMPSAGEQVLAYRPDAPESNDPLIKMATYVGGSAHGHGFDCYCKPTHWMPLPAAPQLEVNRG
ncbi:DUF551 domain-containing protein [Salmonella enterica]|nr:DUF551 domain-containing protein [Salmonella enterica]ECD4681604.1 DUF551 domain-containing protein [Salmonella enterica subsp. enterica serovar Schwarzengrund]EDJ9101787.1 hypothetical protein [Salmonella enterica subsp. enterica serovar Schwarzengrund]